jgi:hypothetical protein
LLHDADVQQERSKPVLLKTAEPWRIILRV